MAAMRLQTERWSAFVPAGLSRAAANPRGPRSSKTAFKRHRQRRCDKASRAAAVMLHLRSRYVSKAAILPIPVRSVPVENRSPA